MSESAAEILARRVLELEAQHDRDQHTIQILSQDCETLREQLALSESCVKALDATRSDLQKAIKEIGR